MIVTGTDGLAAALRAVLAGVILSEGESRDVFDELLDGAEDPARAPVTAGLLVALAQRGESAAEIAGAARALRARMRPFEHEVPDALDTCGTGGDGLGMFNVSTAAALVAAAAGAQVIKHGNRAVSSRSGSADVLEALGGRLDVADDVARGALEETGFTFLFAPRFHPAVGAIAAVRRALGTRTVFNLVGPLANPGGVTRQLLGVAEARFVGEMAAALRALGCRAGLVVHGGGGADELTLEAGAVMQPVGAPGLGIGLDAADLGLDGAGVEALAGGTPVQNARTLREVLGGATGPIADAVRLNAAAVLRIAGVGASASAALDAATEAMASGRALRGLDRWVRLTGGRS